MISPVVLHLKVPRESDRGPIAMENVFSGLSELFKSHPSSLSCELVIRGGFLYLFIVCDKGQKELISGQLFSQYPNLEIEEIGDYFSGFSGQGSMTIVRTERPDIYPIKTYKTLDIDFLSSLSGLANSVRQEDAVVVQIILEPINQDAVGYKLKQSFKNYLRGSLGSSSSYNELLEEGKKGRLAKTLFKVSIRVAAFASNSNLLTTSVSSLFKTLGDPNLNSFKVWKHTQRVSEPDLLDMKQRRFAMKTFSLSAEELATIFHLPSKGSQIAQVATSKSKTSEPPFNLPTEDQVIPFASTTFRGRQIGFGIKREDRRKHLYIIGKTGVGKSKLIELLALSDIREGKGCVIMDPHGDLAEEMLKYIPRKRLYDLIYFNPADTDYPMSFNPMEGVGSFESRQNIVAGFIAIFKKLFSFTWNQRLEHVLRYTTLALLDVPNSTILGITKMLTDTNYRQSVITQIHDPLVKKFWTTEFSSWNDQFAGEAITPIINKVGQFIANPLIRNIVGQAKSSIKLDEIINNEKILIANFSIGKLGEENSALLGAMFVTKLWQAAVARASIPEADRRDTFLYIDEFQNFATSAFSNILSEARKYRLNLTVAHQYMSQLPEEVKSTIFGNIGSIISFRVGGEDASTLEREFRPVFAAEDFMNLDMRNFYVKMTIDGQTAVPFSGKTLDFPKPDEDLMSDAVKLSRERLARPRKEVEEEITRQELGEQKEEIKENKFNEPIV